MKMAIIRSTPILSSFFFFGGVDLLDELGLEVLPDNVDGLAEVVERETVEVDDLVVDGLLTYVDIPI